MGLAVECWLLRRRLLSTSHPRPSSRTLVPEADDDGTEAAAALRRTYLLAPSTRVGSYRPGSGRRHPLRKHRECALTARRAHSCAPRMTALQSHRESALTARREQQKVAGGSQAGRGEVAGPQGHE